MRLLRIATFAAPREFAITRTHLRLPRNQLFPLRTSTADGVSVRLVDPDEPFDRPLPFQPGEPVSHPAFLHHQRGVNPATCVAGLRGGRVWAHRHSAILTADGRLIPELSKDLWGPALHNIYTRASLPRPRRLRGLTLSLLTPEAAANYHHWLIDLLPRIDLAERAGWKLPLFEQVLVAGSGRPFQDETLARAGIDPARIIRLGEHEHVEADLLVVPSIRHDDTRVNAAALDYVRRLFLPPGVSTKPFRRLYLNRHDATHRRVANEPELLPVLRAHGFEHVTLSALTVAEQARLISEAACIVAPNGAGLANLVFAPPSCRVVEFFSPAWVVPYAWLIASHLGLHHTALIGRGPRPSPGTPPRGRTDDADIDPALLEKTLAALPSMMPAAV